MENTPDENPTFLAVFDMFWIDFFETMARMSQDVFFLNTYTNYISKLEDERLRFLCELSPVSLRLDMQQRTKLLYSMLIEPFARLKEQERKKEQRKEKKENDFK